MVRLVILSHAANQPAFNILQLIDRMDAMMAFKQMPDMTRRYEKLFQTPGIA